MKMQFHPKVTAGLLAGAVTTLVVDALARHGVAMSGADGASLAVLFTFVCGYVAPSDDATAAVAPVPSTKPIEVPNA